MVGPRIVGDRRRIAVFPREVSRACPMNSPGKYTIPCSTGSSIHTRAISRESGMEDCDRTRIRRKSSFSGQRAGWCGGGLSRSTACSTPSSGSTTKTSTSVRGWPTLTGKFITIPRSSLIHLGGMSSAPSGRADGPACAAGRRLYYRRTQGSCLLAGLQTFDGRLRHGKSLKCILLAAFCRDPRDNCRRARPPQTRPLLAALEA